MDPAGCQGEARGVRAWSPQRTRSLDTISRHFRRYSHHTLSLFAAFCLIRCSYLQGRQAKSKARVAAFDKMVAEREAARSSERFLSGQIVIPPGPRLGECHAQHMYV